MGLDIRKIFEDSIEAKGIGKKLGEMSTLLGLADFFEGSAILVKHDNGFNVVFIDVAVSVKTENLSVESQYEPTYLFQQAVSEEEARKAYDELNRLQ